MNITKEDLKFRNSRIMTEEYDSLPRRFPIDSKLMDRIIKRFERNDLLSEELMHVYFKRGTLCWKKNCLSDCDHVFKHGFGYNRQDFDYDENYFEESSCLTDLCERFFDSIYDLDYPQMCDLFTLLILCMTDFQKIRYYKALLRIQKDNGLDRKDNNELMERISRVI